MQTGLPARYFTSAEVFDEESQKIFDRSWLYLQRTEALPASGSYQTLEIEGRSLLVVEHESRHRVFHNVCRHRGALLCADRHGQLTNGCLQCPYHAWTYDADGTLRAAPNLANDPNFDRDSLSLIEVPSTDWNGFLMIRLSPDGTDFESDYAAIDQQFNDWQTQALKTAATLEYDVAANWKLLFQNYSECYHCPTVHPALNRLSEYGSATNDLVAGAFLGGPMQLVNDAETMSTDGKFVAPLIPTLNDRQQRQVSYYTLFPSMFVSPHPDYVMVHRLQRLAVDWTHVVCEFLTLDGKSDNVQRAVEFWDTVNRQDWHVCELVQRGSRNPGLPAATYGAHETVLPMFDAHYLSQMGH